MAPIQLPDSDSEDELPPAWEERATSNGYVYYVNHQNKTTQWTHPRTGKSKKVAGDLPFGWERETEPGGRTVFIDTKNIQRTYTDPRLAFAVEEIPRNIGEVRQRFDASSTALQVLHGKDLTGKTALITGCNVGIGFETARSLALHGCDVIMACRNQKATEEAITKIAKEKPAAGKKCRFMKLDLGSLKSVQQFVDDIQKEVSHIDMLILNAAVFALPYSLSEDNIETTFQVCHLSHFHLVTSLENLLDHTSRVVVVSSESHRFSNLPATQLSEQLLMPSPQKYWSMMAYNNAKLCNVLFARELGRRWQTKGICVYSLHPGNMVSSSLSRNWWFYRLIFAIVRPFTKSLQQAASTTIYCATATELTGISGQYYNNCYFCTPSAASQNEEMASSLFDISEKLIKQILN
ncbi:hypothetical protein HA402_000063 [Bradysia odoriphaga]|nr:hypothetical protein HA402_000063 [Bradysia odoriphaga]